LIVSGTIGERDVLEFQRVRGEYGEWRIGITATRQNVENDVVTLTEAGWNKS